MRRDRRRRLVNPFYFSDGETGSERLRLTQGHTAD